MQGKKKLIEVALPLEAINKASAREKSIRHGHPSTLHLWWARRPLAAARAVLFAQMVDDPSAHPDIFRTEKAQEKERQRLFRIIEQLVQWENATNPKVLEAASNEIWQSWRSACALNVDVPRGRELFDRRRLPAFHDPFAGGGGLPLEAQRLGLESYASDLNPVAVVINKAMIEIPPKYCGRAPVHPASSRGLSANVAWTGAQGLAEDVRHYGKWLRDEAARRIGHLYPQVEVTAEIARGRPDLKPLIGRRCNVIAWLWARTVKSPNPAFASVDVPLTSTFVLSSKPNQDVWLEPVYRDGGYSFTVRVGKLKDGNPAPNGTKLGRGHFRCLMSRDTNTPISGEYIKTEGRAGRMGVRLLAVVVESDRGRVYLPPSQDVEEVAQKAQPAWKPEVEFFQQALGFRVGNYGLTRWSDLFTTRQLIALTTFCDLVSEAHEKVRSDALAAGLSSDGRGLSDGGTGALAYADAVCVYLGLAIDKASDYDSALVVWSPTRDQAKTTFSRNALPMVWDFAEVNVFARAAGDIEVSLEGIARVLSTLGTSTQGSAVQADAQTQSVTSDKVVSTDPPYYDNIGYADLSDFFYVWLRRSLKGVFPELFTTVAVPKTEELVATPGRHGGKEQAEAFFLDGMKKAMRRVADQAHPAFPVSIYYAFRQAESNDEGTASTGWETFLEAVIQAGFTICGTWPIRTEREGRTRGLESNALASSIVLVCRHRPVNATATTRREFVTALKNELPLALSHLQRGNIAPVDLAQAAIGPGMSVYSRHEKVLDADGQALKVRDALTLINQVLDECLAKQEGDFDADTRWALAWFEEVGFDAGDFGVAETLSKAKNTSVKGLEEAGILKSGRGKVRLLKSSELAATWDPGTDERLNAWEIVHHLIRALDAGGEPGAAALVGKLGANSEVARELAYRLYTLCERKKRAAEALAYNGLVQSWPEITRLAREGGTTPKATQGALFDNDEG